MIRNLIAGLLLATALAGAARAGGVLDAIHARGTLRVGTTGDYKPFSFRNPDGSYQGADIDMARSLADALHVRLELVPTAWGRMMDDFKADRFDLAMGGVTILPPRAAVGDFTPSVYTDGKRPVVRCADRDRYNSIAAIDLPAVRVVVNPGASNEEFARKNFPQAQLAVHADNPTVPDEIVAGRADVFVTDGIEVDHIAMVHPQLCPADMKQGFTSLEKAYWLQRDPEFLHAVDDWLAGQMNSGRWQQVLKTAQAAP